MGATPSGATGQAGSGAGSPAVAFPSAQPTGAAGQGGSTPAAAPAQGGQPSSSEPGRDPKTGQFVSGQGGIKPIPPKQRPRLPGVRPDLPADSPLSELPDFVKPLAHQISESKAAAARSRDGRDSEPTPPPQDQPTQGQDGQPDPNTPPADPNAAAPFQFAKKTWKNQQEAEQSFLSMQGTFKANAQRAQHFDKANDSAARWRQVAIDLGYRDDGSHRQAQPQGGSHTAAQVQGQPPTGSTSPGASQVPESIDGILESLDLGLYNSISEQQGPQVAALWLVREALKGADRVHQARLEKVQAPFSQFQQHLQVQGAATNLIEAARQVEVPGPDGQLVPMYPELDDAAALHGIAEIWSRLNFPDTHRLTPMALHLAVLAYRDYLRLYGQGQGSATPPNLGAQGQQPNPADQIAAEITQQLTGGAGQPDPISGVSLPNGRSSGNPRVDEADNVRREIRDAKVPDPVLGFVVSPSWKKNKR